MKRWTMLMTAALGATACAVDTTDHVAANGEAITGYLPNAGLAGLMLVTTPDGIVHTSVLVAPSLVVTATSVVRGQSVTGITVEYGVDNSHPTGSVRHVVAAVQHPQLQAVYLQLDSSYAATQYTLPLDTRDPSQVPSGLACTGYDQSRHLWRNQVSTSNRGSWTFNVTPTMGSLSDADGGIPCVDFGTGTAVGITFSANTEITARTLEDWLPVATTLGPIASGGRFALHNANDKCLDVAWAGLGDGYGVNQYACHYGYNQLWYFDYRGANPTIVSANSGKCLDAPSGMLSTALQQYTCHGGTNQQYQWYWWNPALSFVSQLADHWTTNPAASACLSVVGGSTADGAHTELRSCSGTNDQRWSIEWR